MELGATIYQWVGIRSYDVSLVMELGATIYQWGWELGATMYQWLLN